MKMATALKTPVTVAATVRCWKEVSRGLLKDSELRIGAALAARSSRSSLSFFVFVSEAVRL